MNHSFIISAVKYKATINISVSFKTKRPTIDEIKAAVDHHKCSAINNIMYIGKTDKEFNEIIKFQSSNKDTNVVFEFLGIPYVEISTQNTCAGCDLNGIGVPCDTIKNGLSCTNKQFRRLA